MPGRNLNTISFRKARNTSDLRRPMSVWDGFVYNFLTMGVIFPWIYLWGPAAFSGGSLQMAVFITLVVQLPISLAYCFLATILPVSGGDYIYQTRAFGKCGFVIVMSGFVIWILQWVALSGWLFATLGLAPLFLFLGVQLRSTSFVWLAIHTQNPWGVAIISILLSLLTVLFLNRGLRKYVRVQKWLFVLTLASMITVPLSLYAHRNTFDVDLNAFVSQLSSLGGAVPSVLQSNFASKLQELFPQPGATLLPWIATLGMVPIAWTSLQWSTYSVEQNTEISAADRLRPQVFMIVCSAVAVAACLLVMSFFLRRVVSDKLLYALSHSYWNAPPSTVSINEFLTDKFQPFPNVLAIAATKSIAIAVLISLGYLANAFQVTCNSFIGATRIIAAMAADGALPPRLRLNEVSAKHHAPINAQWLYFIGSIPIIVASSTIKEWKDIAAACVTFACGYVFVGTCLAATRIPSSRLRSYWLTSDIRWLSGGLIKATAYGGAFLGAAMVVAYILVPQLRVASRVVAGCLVLSSIGLSFGVYCWAKAKNPRLDQVFRTVPYEAPEFCEEEQSVLLDGDAAH